MLDAAPRLFPQPSVRATSTGDEREQRVHSGPGAASGQAGEGGRAQPGASSATRLHSQQVMLPVRLTVLIFREIAVPTETGPRSRRERAVRFRGARHHTESARLDTATSPRRAARGLQSARHTASRARQL